MQWPSTWQQLVGVLLCFYLRRRQTSSVTRSCVARHNRSADPCWAEGWNDSGSLGSPPSPAPAHKYDQTFNTTTRQNLIQLLLFFCYMRFSYYHDNKGYVCWPQSFKSFWSVSRPPVVKVGTGDIEPARCVDGQLPIDEILFTLTLQHYDTEERDIK